MTYVGLFKNKDCKKNRDFKNKIKLHYYKNSVTVFFMSPFLFSKKNLHCLSIQSEDLSGKNIVCIPLTPFNISTNMLRIFFKTSKPVFFLCDFNQFKANFTANSLKTVMHGQYLK